MRPGEAAAIPNPGTGKGDPRVAAALLTRFQSARESRQLPRAVVVPPVTEAHLDVHPDPPGQQPCGCRLLRPCRACRTLILMKDAAEPVSSKDVKLIESAWFGERLGVWVPDILSQGLI
jgi:hypothetical protein